MDRPWWGHGLKVLQPLDAPYGIESDAGELACNPVATDVLVMEGVLTLEERREALRLARKRPAQRGEMLGGREGIRECQCTWIPQDDEGRWLYERIGATFEKANATYRFRLGGLIEPVMAVGYETGNRFDWHLDAGDELAANRKLSLSLLLTGHEHYEGGELEFAGRSAPSRVEGGTAIVFPSFLAHRVAPITCGYRISLVAFAYGPTFV